VSIPQLVLIADTAVNLLVARQAVIMVIARNIWVLAMVVTQAVNLMAVARLATARDGLAAAPARSRTLAAAGILDNLVRLTAVVGLQLPVQPVLA